MAITSILAAVVLCAPPAVTPASAHLPPLEQAPSGPAADRHVQRPERPERLERLERLAIQLGSDRATRRDRAMRALLRDRSTTAVAPLVRLAIKGDIEAVARATSVLHAYSLADDPRLADAALAGLQRVARRERAGAFARRVLRSYSRSVAKQVKEAVEASGGAMTFEPNGHAHIALNRDWNGDEDVLRRVQRMTPIRRLSLEDSAITDKSIALLAGADVQRLLLCNTLISHRGLAALGKMPAVRDLHLDGMQLGGCPAALFEAFPNLERLALINSDATNADMAALQTLEQLHTLLLDHTAIDDRGLRRLRDLPRLTCLHLRHTQVTGAGLQNFPARLRVLMLKKCPLTDQGMRHLRRFNTLTELGLDHTQVGDRQLRHVANLQQLGTLWLSRTKVTDQGLATLASCPSLHTVFVHGAPITAVGRTALRSALPNCRIEGVRRSPR